jgi:hypothetical protein
MFTIMWNPNGFYVVDRLPNDMKINSAYFLTNIIIPFEEAIFPRGRAPHERLLVVHLDNAQFTQVGFQKIGLKKAIFFAYHTRRIQLIWPLVTSTCFLQ